MNSTQNQSNASAVATQTAKTKIVNLREDIVEEVVGRTHWTAAKAVRAHLRKNPELTRARVGSLKERLRVVKRRGRHIIEDLDLASSEEDRGGYYGLGATFWAPCGRPEENAGWREGCISGARLYDEEVEIGGVVWEGVES